MPRKSEFAEGMEWLPLRVQVACPCKRSADVIIKKDAHVLCRVSSVNPVFPTAPSFTMNDKQSIREPAIMRWEKLGLVFKLAESRLANHKNAMVPTPFLLPSGKLRVYMTVCDQANIGRIFYVEFDSVAMDGPPSEVMGPVLDVGTPGSFDEHGVVVAQIMQVSDTELWMYYSGFERLHDQPYRILTGVARSVDGGSSFGRNTCDPILRQSPKESLFRCAPFVLRSAQGYTMWYVAGSSWEVVQGKHVPRYSLYTMHSPDGVTWPDEGLECLKLGPNEHGFGRPWILREGGVLRLFYSIRRIDLAAYALGYAESRDGIYWQRMDHCMGLDTSQGQFDSTAMSYTAIITTDDSLYCLYNGDNFGRDGFAAARSPIQRLRTTSNAP